jgi:hypothetical protein
VLTPGEEVSDSVGDSILDESTAWLMATSVMAVAGPSDYFNRLVIQFQKTFPRDLPTSVLPGLTEFTKEVGRSGWELGRHGYG